MRAKHYTNRLATISHKRHALRGFTSRSAERVADAANGLNLYRALHRFVEPALPASRPAGFHLLFERLEAR